MSQQNEINQIVHHHQVPPITRSAYRQRRLKAKPRPSTAPHFNLSAEDVDSSSTLAIATFVSTSADGRRQSRRTKQLIGPFRLKRIPEEEDKNYRDDLPFFDAPTAVEGHEPEPSQKVQARRYLSSVSDLESFSMRHRLKYLQDKPLEQWVEAGCPNAYLDELICLEGRRQHTSVGCPSCVRRVVASGTLDPDHPITFPSPTIRCNECFGGELVCVECCLRNHIYNPLHAIKVRRKFHFHLAFRSQIPRRSGMAFTFKTPPWLKLDFVYSWAILQASAASIPHQLLRTSPSSTPMDSISSISISVNVIIIQRLVPISNNSCGANGTQPLTQILGRAQHSVFSSFSV